MTRGGMDDSRTDGPRVTNTTDTVRGAALERTLGTAAVIDKPPGPIKPVGRPIWAARYFATRHIKRVAIRPRAGFARSPRGRAPGGPFGICAFMGRVCPVFSYPQGPPLAAMLWAHG